MYSILRSACGAATIACAVLTSPGAAQSAGSAGSVEDIVILRSLRQTRTTPSEFCATTRTGFPPANVEDRYDFLPVATDATSGVVINASGTAVGTLRACFGPSGESQVSTFYAEGEVHGMPLVGRGQCRTTRRDFPESGISAVTCQLDLTGLPAAYVGGQLTTNTLTSRASVGPTTDPPGYTQVSIATIRLWKKR